MSKADENFSVQKIAKLAYLKLTDGEAKAFESQFSQILKYVDQLEKVPMNAEESKSMGAFHITNAFYESFGLHQSSSLRLEDQEKDVNLLNLTNEEALKNAPKSGGIPGELLYEVPSIIERS